MSESNSSLFNISVERTLLFKLEPKLQNPEIAIIRDMIGPEEMNRVKNLAKGKMKSTPYIKTSNKETLYSKVNSKSLSLLKLHSKQFIIKA